MRRDQACSEHRAATPRALWDDPERTLGPGGPTAAYGEACAASSPCSCSWGATSALVTILRVPAPATPPRVEIQIPTPTVDADGNSDDEAPGPPKVAWRASTPLGSPTNGRLRRGVQLPCARGALRHVGPGAQAHAEPVVAPLRHRRPRARLAAGDAAVRRAPSARAARADRRPEPAARRRLRPPLRAARARLAPERARRRRLLPAPDRRLRAPRRPGRSTASSRRTSWTGSCAPARGSSSSARLGPQRPARRRRCPTRTTTTTSTCASSMPGERHPIPRDHWALRRSARHGGESLESGRGTVPCPVAGSPRSRSPRAASVQPAALMPTTLVMRTRLFMPLDDPEEIEFRARDIVIGSVLGVATAVAIIAYLAQSPGSRHRALLAIVCVGWVLVSRGVVPAAASAPGRLALARAVLPGLERHGRRLDRRGGRDRGPVRDAVAGRLHPADDLRRDLLPRPDDGDRRPRSCSCPPRPRPPSPGSRPRTRRSC